MPFVSVQFRSQPVEVNPTEIPLIMNPMTKKIAANFGGKVVPAFIAPEESLAGRIKTLSDLEAELKEAENSKKKQESLYLELQKEVEGIDLFLDGKHRDFDQLEEEKKKIDQEYSEKSKEKEGLEKEIKQSQSVKEANEELENAIANVDRFRAGFKEAQAENQRQILMSLLKAAAAVALAAAGILMRRSILAKQSSCLLIGGVFSSLSLGAYFAKEAFDRLSILESAEEELSRSVREKAENLDRLEKRKNINEQIKLLEQTFGKLLDEQDRIEEEAALKEDSKEELLKRFDESGERIKKIEEKLKEISEKQSACIEEIKEEISKKDLRSCSKYFQNLKKELDRVVKELEEANISIRISESVKRKRPEHKESKEEASKLEDAKKQVIEKAQLVEILVKELDVALADRVEGYYKTALEECSRVVEFLERIDPCDDPQTPEFYKKCEELLIVFYQKISAFEKIDRQMNAIFKDLGIPYSKDLTKLLKNLKKGTKRTPKSIPDVLKAIYEKSKGIVTVQKEKVEEEDDDEDDDDLEEKLSEQFSLLFTACDEFRKVYSENMNAYVPIEDKDPGARRRFREFNAVHQNFCDSFLEVLSVGNELAKQFDLAEGFDLVCKGWKEIAGTTG